jgi:hypothetical protein
MWTQIVGKTRMVLSPAQNHWWHVPLYVTPRGLTTSAIPCRGDTFEVAFDFLAHQLSISTCHGIEHRVRLYPRSVADFYSEYMACLRSLGIEAHFDRVPAEFDDLTPYDEDRHHASYDRDAVERFHAVLLAANRVFKKFQTPFLGKTSPVHFFWGSFDLAVTRFSGRRAPQRDGVDPVTAEAYSHEVISHGFWPGDRRYPHAAFYSYTAPGPPGLEKKTEFWNTQLGEFLLDYEIARQSKSPEDVVLDFCRRTYDAGADLAKWDRAALDR